jgi:hypothetical protein
MVGLRRCLRRPVDPVFGAPREHGRNLVMVRIFSLATTVATSSLLERARRVAKENGATLLGDEGSGRFSHPLVRGEYRMVAQTVTVTITDKQWPVPWPMVESQLRALIQ